jgi:hypothetical protein
LALAAALLKPEVEAIGLVHRLVVLAADAHAQVLPCAEHALVLKAAA